MRSPKQILRPVIFPLLACSFFLQAVMSMLRILTSYGVLETGAGAGSVGLISAVFALLPVLLTVPIGRLNDKGGAGRAMVAGAGCSLAAALILALAPAGMATFLAGNSVLGIGHTLMLSALQMIAASASSMAHRDGVIGNFMVAMGLGHVVGPLIVGLCAADTALTVTAVFAVLLLGLSILMLRRLPVSRSRAQGNASLRQVAATPGLWWIILLGSFTVATQDMILAFTPVLGAERGLSTLQVGILLSIRATAAMLSRALYSRGVAHFGRMRLTLLSVGIGGVSVLAMMPDVPLAVLGVSMAATGFGLGIALTSTIALTMLIAPRAVRGKALSLRLTANRVAQFGIPLVASAVIAPVGVGGVFGLCGAILLGAAAVRPRDLRGRML